MRQPTDYYKTAVDRRKAIAFDLAERANGDGQSDKARPTDPDPIVAESPVTLQDEFYEHYNKSNTRQAIDVFLVGLAALAVPLPAPSEDDDECV